MTKADVSIDVKPVEVKKATAKKRVKIGIVGCGGIGKVHLNTYNKIPEAEVVAVCDIIKERAEFAKEKYGVPRTYQDYTEMLETEKLDAVAVCVPNAMHAPVAIAALKAGCHVFCEKPMSVNAKDAQKMADAAAASGKIFQMGFNNRFRGDTRVLKSFIDKGAFGEVYYARCGWIRRMGIPGMGGWFTQKAQSGGGPLIDIGVHVLDLTLYLLGNPKPVSAYGSTYAKFGPEGRGMGGWGTADRSGKGGFDVEDLATALIKFENGMTVQLEASWASYIPRDRFYSTILGTKGGGDLDPLAIYTEMNGVQVDITPDFPQINGHEAEQFHFIECILKGKQPIATAQHGLDVMKILDAIYESAKTGQSVAIK